MPSPAYISRQVTIEYQQHDPRKYMWRDVQTFRARKEVCKISYGDKKASRGLTSFV